MLHVSFEFWSTHIFRQCILPALIVVFEGIPQLEKLVLAELDAGKFSGTISKSGDQGCVDLKYISFNMHHSKRSSDLGDFFKRCIFE